MPAVEAVALVLLGVIACALGVSCCQCSTPKKSGEERAALAPSVEIAEFAYPHPGQTRTGRASDLDNLD